MTGDIADITFDNVKYGQIRAAANADLPLAVSAGVQQPRYPEAHGPLASFTVDPPVFAPGQYVTFTAAPSPSARYTWLFGDGTEGHGRRVRHRFPDAEGTELDGSTAPDGPGRPGLLGRFRVLLHVETPSGPKNPDSAAEDWAAQGVVAVDRWNNPVSATGPTLAGLAWRIYPGEWTELPDLTGERPVFAGDSPNLRADPQGFTHYVALWDGFIDIPADGAYTFYLEARDGARLVIDGVEAGKTGPPFAQVCGSPGNAMRYDRGSLGLRAGKHTFHLEGLHSASQGEPRLLWEGPALPLTDVPPAAYSHPRQDALKQGTENSFREPLKDSPSVAGADKVESGGKNTDASDEFGPAGGVSAVR